MAVKRGRHFLQIPGPSNVPDRVLRAMDRATIDHRGPEFAILGTRLLARIKPVFGATQSYVLIYPGSGTGAWEAALVNTLSPGDTVLMCETGQFAALWREVALRFGLNVDWIESDWRRAADANAISDHLKADKTHTIKAVCVVHNETSTGVTNRIDEVRAAIDNASHPALLMVDTVSSLGSIDYQHDDWGVDVTVAASQKGLMLPPGLSFNAISAKAIDAGKQARLPRSYWDWGTMLKANADGYFPYTPATNLLYALDEALAMLEEEGLPNVFARHARFAEATRRAATAWGLELQCAEPRDYSNVLTAIRTPDGFDADQLRKLILDHFDLSLGTGLGKVQGKVFRIGHLGDLNDLTLAGTLCGVEMGLALANVPHQTGGVDAAMRYLAETALAS
jgi:alanine-glyoxylate transaminase/serine-glyoxylate transaminase/serine-pyruvate transaminase